MRCRSLACEQGWGGALIHFSPVAASWLRVRMLRMVFLASCCSAAASAQGTQPAAPLDPRTRARIDSFAGLPVPAMFAYVRAHPTEYPFWLGHLARQEGSRPVSRATLDEIADSLEARGDVSGLVSISEGEVTLGGVPYPGVLDRLMRLVQQQHNASIALHHILHVGERARALAYVRSVITQPGPLEDYRPVAAVSTLMEESRPNYGNGTTAAQRTEALALLKELYTKKLVPNAHAWQTLLPFAIAQHWKPPSIRRTAEFACSKTAEHRSDDYQSPAGCRVLTFNRLNRFVSETCSTSAARPRWS